MKNLKKSFIIIMAFVLVFVSGCSSEKANTEKKEIQTAEKIVTSSAESIDHKRVVVLYQSASSHSSWNKCCKQLS